MKAAQFFQHPQEPVPSSNSGAVRPAGELEPSRRTLAAARAHRGRVHERRVLCLDDGSVQSQPSKCRSAVAGRRSLSDNSGLPSVGNTDGQSLAR